jgi:hypothetical protein
MKKEYEIYWSPEAEETYLKTLTDILCPPSQTHKQFRKCVIAPQTSLIYRVTDDTIELVSFIDNRSLQYIPLNTIKCYQMQNTVFTLNMQKRHFVDCSENGI